MTEGILYQKYVKPLLIRKGYYFYRIEHFKIPDIYCCRNNRVTWIELKVINKKKKEILEPAWRPGQLSWVKEHNLFGNNDSREKILLCLWYMNNYYFLHPKKVYTLGELKTSIQFN